MVSWPWYSGHGQWPPYEDYGKVNIGQVVTTKRTLEKKPTGVLLTVSFDLLLPTADMAWSDL